MLGCMMLYSARTVMPLCIVTIGQEMKWDKQQSVSIYQVLQAVALYHPLLLLSRYIESSL